MMRARTIVFAIGASFLALAASAAAAEPLHIRIAWQVPVGNWASLIFEKKDLMTHYGQSYVAEPVHFQSTPTMITALSAGEIDIADLAFSTFAIAIENAGMSDLRVIADEGRDGYDDYLSGPYVVLKDAPIHSVADLKGKVIATPAAGAAVDIPVRALLRRSGLETPRDYTMVEAAFPNMPPMLMEHKIDLMPAVRPFSNDPRFQAATRTLFTAKEAMGGPIQLIIWTAKAGFIAQHRAAMLDFMEDAVRAVRFFTDPKNHEAVVEIAARVAKQPPQAMEYVFTKADTYRDPDMRPNLAMLQRAVDVQRAAGFLKAPLEVKTYADLSLLQDATARIK